MTRRQRKAAANRRQGLAIALSGLAGVTLSIFAIGLSMDALGYGFAKHESGNQVDKAKCLQMVPESERDDPNECAIFIYQGQLYKSAWIQLTGGVCVESKTFDGVKRFVLWQGQN